MLVQWGCDIADKMGVEASIEGTFIARRLYESCGFVVTPTDWIIVNVPDKWKHESQIKYFFFERQPRNKVVEGTKDSVEVDIREAVVAEVS